MIILVNISWKTAIFPDWQRELSGIVKALGDSTVFNRAVHIAVKLS